MQNSKLLNFGKYRICKNTGSKLTCASNIHQMYFKLDVLLDVVLKSASKVHQGNNQLGTLLDVVLDVPLKTRSSA